MFRFSTVFSPGLVAATAASAVPVNDEIDDAIALPGAAGSLIGTTVDATPIFGLPNSFLFI